MESSSSDWFVYIKKKLFNKPTTACSNYPIINEQIKVWALKARLSVAKP